MTNRCVELRSSKGFREPRMMGRRNGWKRNSLVATNTKHYKSPGKYVKLQEQLAKDGAGKLFQLLGALQQGCLLLRQKHDPLQFQKPAASKKTQALRPRRSSYLEFFNALDSMQSALSTTSVTPRCANCANSSKNYDNSLIN